MTKIALAAISARVLAEAAAREGLGAVALDLFGDRDTQRAASAWLPIGAPASLQIDAAALLDALEALAHRGDVAGWVAGAGFEGRPDLLAQGAARLPLLGTAGADQRRVRDPATFFGFLKACGFSYPAVRHTVSGDPHGWLVKDAGGCGGWHIRRASAAEPAAVSPGHYLQREARGVPMSATFVANGRDAVLLGFNEQIVRPLGARPYVYAGVLGPVSVAADVAREVGAVVRACAEMFALRGLASLDFLLDGERVLVLEVNPRPPASLALYARAGDRGVLGAHLRACRDGVLPHGPALERPGGGQVGAAPPASSAEVQGSEIVFAPRALQLDADLAARLERLADTHDLPRAATDFAAGDPVCSVSARGATAAAVKAELARRRDALLRTLESLR